MENVDEETKEPCIIYYSMNLSYVWEKKGMDCYPQIEEITITEKSCLRGVACIKSTYFLW